MKITPEIRAFILARLGEGMTHDKIRASIAKSHGLKIDRTSITKLSKAVRTERAETAKVVLREQIGDELTRDLQQIAKNQRRLERFIRQTYENARKFPEEYKPFMAALAEYRSTLELKFRHSGANEPDEALGSLSDIMGAALAAENECR